jgi:hypothetical protein
LGNLVIGKLRIKKAIGFNFPITQLQNYSIKVRMYHYDPKTALEELTEDATLPNPVHVRDMILRKHPSTDKALELNRMFVEYQKTFGEAQKLGKEILKELVG